MSKELIMTDKAPRAIGPYTQAVKIGNLLFLSGQLPANPITGEIIGEIKAQTRQSLENIQSILASADSSMQDIVKTTVFLKNLDDFNSMNEIYQEYFPENPPARACIEVSRIPKDALIEIEAISIIGAA